MYLYIFSLEYLFMVRLWICKCRSFQELLFTDILQNFAKFTLKHLCRSLIFDKVADRRPANSVKKKSATLVFFCEFSKILKNSFIYRTSPAAASAFTLRVQNLNDITLAVKTKPWGKKVSLTEVYLEPYKTFVTKRFCEIIRSFWPLTFFSQKTLSQNPKKP